MNRLITAIDADMFENSVVGLERQLTRRVGIDRVEVDPSAHTVTVDFDAARVKPADVERFIAECGYRGFAASTESRQFCENFDEAALQDSSARKGSSSTPARNSARASGLALTVSG